MKGKSYEGVALKGGLRRSQTSFAAFGPYECSGMGQTSIVIGLPSCVLIMICIDPLAIGACTAAASSIGFHATDVRDPQIPILQGPAVLRCNRSLFFLGHFFYLVSQRSLEDSQVISGRSEISLISRRVSIAF